LCNGVIFAYFKQVGKIPFRKQSFTASDSISLIVGATILRTLVLMFEGPVMLYCISDLE